MFISENESHAEDHLLRWLRPWLKAWSNGVVYVRLSVCPVILEAAAAADAIDGLCMNIAAGEAQSAHISALLSEGRYPYLQKRFTML